MRAWWCVVMVVVVVASPNLTWSFTLDGYFKMLELVTKTRDMWRKILLGNDIGFVASPWLFKDRVKPPYVPMVTTFPKSPVNGHYRNECAQTTPPPASSPPVATLPTQPSQNRPEAGPLEHPLSTIRQK
ncbi:uncharacterized protein [Procambarus clarkii]|uniref:uncharacterized protein n=1 Tax=Procambarus clarkii TaxID=6728 RepID=UPI001E676DEE|nr:uncharacterized protein LOC123762706 [Procambarus clarkii]XP_045605364.1 uncharacterized protein LOC123762706 [Procambarus clarkii]